MRNPRRSWWGRSRCNPSPDRPAGRCPPGGWAPGRGCPRPAGRPARPLDRERAAERVHRRQRGVTDVLGGVVVVDRTVEPLPAVDPEAVAGFDPCHRRDRGVPTVVTDLDLVGELPLRVERENQLWHGWIPFGAARRSRPRQATGSGMGDRRASGTAPRQGRDDFGLEGAALRALQPGGHGGRSTREHRR